jgi:hypothetical protein
MPSTFGSDMDALIVLSYLSTSASPSISIGFLLLQHGGRNFSRASFTKAPLCEIKAISPGSGLFLKKVALRLT